MMKEQFDQSDRYWDSIESHYDQQDKKLEEFMEMARGTSKRLAGLEQNARQPRLAMEADVQAHTKTRERTGGAATAVQAMHGDSCSTNRVDPNSMCSTSFGGDFIGPPALPCSRDDAVVGNGAAAPSRVSHPWRCAHQQPPVAYSSPAQPLQRRGPPSTSQLFGSARPKRQN